MNILTLLLASGILAALAWIAPVASAALRRMELQEFGLAVNEVSRSQLLSSAVAINMAHNLGLKSYAEETGMGYEGGQTLALGLNSSSGLDSSSLSQPLTAYSVGYSQEDKLKILLEYICGNVPTSRRFDYFFAPKATIANQPDPVQALRAPGADFARVRNEEGIATGKLYDKGFTYVLDSFYDGDVQLKKQREIARLARMLWGAEVVEAIALLDAIATNVNVDWTAAGADPDIIIQERLEATLETVGVEGNRVLMANKLWTARKKHYRALDNAGGYASAGMTPDDLANSLNLDPGSVQVNKAIKGTRVAGKKNYVASDALFSFNSQSNVTENDASCIKRFTHEGEGGGDIQVHEREISKRLTAITVCMASAIKQTSETGVYKQTVTHA